MSISSHEIKTSTHVWAAICLLTIQTQTSVVDINIRTPFHFSSVMVWDNGLLTRDNKWVLVTWLWIQVCKLWVSLLASDRTTKLKDLRVLMVPCFPFDVCNTNYSSCSSVSAFLPVFWGVLVPCCFCFWCVFSYPFFRFSLICCCCVFDLDGKNLLLNTYVFSKVVDSVGYLLMN